MIIQGTSPAVEIYQAVLTALEAVERQEDPELDQYLDGLTVREHQLGVIEGLRRIADRIEYDLDDDNPQEG